MQRGTERENNPDIHGKVHERKQPHQIRKGGHGEPAKESKSKGNSRLPHIEKWETISNNV